MQHTKSVDTSTETQQPQKHVVRKTLLALILVFVAIIGIGYVKQAFASMKMEEMYGDASVPVEPIKNGIDKDNVEVFAPDEIGAVITDSTEDFCEADLSRIVWYGLDKDNIGLFESGTFEFKTVSATVTAQVFGSTSYDVLGINLVIDGIHGTVGETTTLYVLLSVE